MKRRLGYSIREAEKAFYDSCDGINLTCLLEVFERPNGYDGERMVVSRPHDEFVAIGEVWVVDEDGLDEITKPWERWDFRNLETVGFGRDELRDMKEAGER
jgi:hypothetical protein